MKTVLLALLGSILSSMGVPKGTKLKANDPLVVRYAGCVDDVVEVTNELPEYMRSVWASVTIVMVMAESACQANPPGHNDDGKACGPLQTHHPEWDIPGATCDKVRKDRKLGIRVGLTRMIRLSRDCGSIGAGLTAYAMTGTCPKGWVLPLVAKRLKIAGIDPSAPWSPGA